MASPESEKKVEDQKRLALRNAPGRSAAFVAAALGQSLTYQRLLLLNTISNGLDRFHVSDADAIELVDAFFYAMQVPSLAVTDVAGGSICTQERLAKEVEALCQKCEEAGHGREMAYHLVQAASVWLRAAPPAVTMPARLTVSERVKALALW